jgi:16S rRNA (uracil1498-N3)-methyltransferase
LSSSFFDMITNFYTDPEKVGKNSLTVDGDEAKHILSVLRYERGDEIGVVDGRGTRYQAEIVKTSKNSLEAKILSRTRMVNEPHCRVTLAQAVCRQERMDFVIEKATEIGVFSIVPMLTERGVVKVTGSQQRKRKIERWRRIAIAAMKQSLRTVLPEIQDFTEFDDLMVRSNHYDLCLIASLKKSSKNLSECRQLKNGLKDVLLIVGPEAGFTDRELSRAEAAGAVSVSLGLRRLRAETAGVVFSSLVLHRLADLG